MIDKIINSWQCNKQYMTDELKRNKKLLQEYSGLGSFDCEDERNGCQLKISEISNKISLITHFLNDLVYLRNDLQQKLDKLKND